MDTAHLLIKDRAERMKFALKLLNKTEEDLWEDIKIIKEWLKDQVHLPETPNEKMIITFLFNNKFSIENVKSKLDMYYTIRRLIPEMYENKNPKLPNMLATAKVMYCIPLPKITKEGYRITVVKTLEDYPTNYDAYNFFAYIQASIEVRIQEDIPLGEIAIYDFQYIKIGHLMQITPVHIKKIMTIVEKVYSNRMKALWYINAPPFIDTLVQLVKPALKGKLANRLHVLQKTDSITNHLPKEILPKDYGGDELSLRELHDLWTKKLAEYGHRFDALDEMRVNENLRPTPLVNDDFLGFHGNFKKLTVD